MNSIARISKLSITVAKRAAVNRTLFTRSAVVCGADKHAHDAHGHDDHEHHEHKLFEEIPFKKGPIAAMVFGGTFVGVALIVLACKHQNKKHGFST